MGTRADFYVGRGPTARWIGSIAYDGRPDAVFVARYRQWRQPEDVKAWRFFVTKRLRFYANGRSRDDGTFPKDGWPWPWNDSRTTDYAYTWHRGQVWVSRFGLELIPLSQFGLKNSSCDGPKILSFPDMSAKKNVTYGSRSGVLFVGTWR